MDEQNYFEKKGDFTLKGESVKIDYTAFSLKTAKITLSGTFIYEGEEMVNFPFLQIDMKAENQQGDYSYMSYFSYLLPQMMPIRSFREFLIRALRKFCNNESSLLNEAVRCTIQYFSDNQVAKFCEVAFLLNEMKMAVSQKLKNEDSIFIEKILTETEIEKRPPNVEKNTFGVKVKLLNLEVTDPGAETISRKVLEIFGCGTALDVKFEVV